MVFREYTHHLQSVNLRRIFELGFFKPLTVIAPAFNESATIVSSVHSLLNLQYPEFEILVINDGSTDHTLAWWRFIALLEYVLGKRSWGTMERKGFSANR